MPRFHRGGAAIARAALLSCTVISSAWADNSVEPTKLDEIVVTATPFSSDPNRLATLVGQVNREEILQRGGANLADALADIPGVTGSGFAAGASRPIIRGFDANRVKVLENGVGSFDVSDVGPDHGTPIDPLSTQEIEVVRGAATLRFGSQAIGGVVNAINNRVPLQESDRPFKAEASTSYGSAADGVEGSALVEARSGAFAVHADAFGRHTSDYAIPGGKQDNSFFRGTGGSFGAAMIGEQAKAGAAVVRYDSRYGIPAEDNYIDMKQTKGLARSVVDFEGGVFDSLNVDGGYASYEHSEKDQNGIAQSTFKDKEWDARAEAVAAAGDWLSASALGVQAQHRDFSALGEGGDYLLPTTTKSAAIFGFGEVPLSEAVKLQAGARVEHSSVDGTPLSGVPTSRDFTPVSGAVSVVVTPTREVTLGLTVSSAARAPAQTELFARGPHDGPRTFELGSATLGLERANGLEATARFTEGWLSVEGAAWVSRFDGYVYGRLTGRSCDDEGVCAPGDAEELRELIYEQRDATFRGLEAKAKITAAQTSQGSLTFDVMADFVRATLSGGGNVPRIPPYHVGVGATWTSGDFDAGVSWKYTGQQNKFGAGDTPTDGFSSLDARLTWRADTKANLRFDIIGRNLTNTEQHNAVALNKDEVTQPGRDIRLVARVGF